MIDSSSQQLNQQANRQLMDTLSRWDTRLRISQLALWVPRGAVVGLTVGLIGALISWLRPLLLGPQILGVALGTMALGMIVAGVSVMLWPRSMMDKARYFDQRFGLKERSSTALELAAGKIDAPGPFQQLVLTDAIQRAQRINPADFLRVQWRRNELIGLAIMILLLLLSVFATNPQAMVINQQVAVNAAISQQVSQLEQVKRDIQSNSALTDAEKAQLNKIIEDAIKQLQQPNITQAEAVAALADAQQQLNSNRSQLSPAQKSAANEAGTALNATRDTQGIGQALQKGDLNGAAGQLDSLAEKVAGGQMTQNQMNDAATALENAANNMENLNPEVADALRKAADALRSGNASAAQQALQDAANALRDQQSGLDRSPLSQAANQLGNQMNQGQQQVAQAGRQNLAQNGKPGQQQANAQAGQQNQQGQQQAGQQGQNQQNANQQGQQNQQNQQGQQGQQGQSPQSGNNGQQGQQNQQGQQGQQPQSQSGQQGQQGQEGQQGQQGQQSPSNQQGQQGQNQQAGNQSGQQGGNNPQQSQDGSQGGIAPNSGNNQPGSQQAGGSGQQSGPNGQQNSSSQDGQGNADQGAGAGQGSGGAGNDTTTGSTSGSNGQDANNFNGNGNVVPPENVFAPTFIGGEGGPEINPNGTNSGNASEPGQQGDFTNNPRGRATVPLSSVSSQAAAQADRAMDADHIPGALRGVVRDYFTGLQNTGPR